MKSDLCAQGLDILTLWGDVSNIKALSPGVAYVPPLNTSCPWLLLEGVPSPPLTAIENLAYGEYCQRVI